jgi:hypothetical protein
MLFLIRFELGSERCRCSRRQCHLWVLEQNARAIRFYEAAGFEWDKSPAKTFELGGVTLKELRFSCPLAV